MPSASAAERDARPPSGSEGPGWTLAGYVGDQEGLSHVPIAKNPFVIGRDPASDLCLESRLVSKRHAELVPTARKVVVNDLGSTNGTFVNGRRIREPTPIDDSDLVQFAACEFRLDRKQAPTDAQTAMDYSLEEFWLFSRMQEVLQENRLRMVYQPIVTDLHAPPVACEALVRTDIPGWTNPVQLFDAAVKLKVEKQLSELCRSEAVKTLKGQSAPELLFVNTHPHETLGPELIESLNALRQAAGKRRLVLEIHEASVSSLKVLREFRAALHDLDIGLAYDDFGSGASRLLELAEVPPDYLKFDRGLVKDLGSASAPQTALVRTLHHHAEDLGIITLAEGLDTKVAYEACRDIGFTHFQGFLFGRPQGVAEMARACRSKSAETYNANLEQTGSQRSISK